MKCKETVFDIDFLSTEFFMIYGLCSLINFKRMLKRTFICTFYDYITTFLPYVTWYMSRSYTFF